MTRVVWAIVVVPGLLVVVVVAVAVDDSLRAVSVVVVVDFAVVVAVGCDVLRMSWWSHVCDKNDVSSW